MLSTGDVPGGVDMGHEPAPRSFFSAPRTPMRLEIPGPRFGSLNRKCQSFVGGRSTKVQTHATHYMRNVAGSLDGSPAVRNPAARVADDGLPAAVQERHAAAGARPRPRNGALARCAAGARRRTRRCDGVAAERPCRRAPLVFVRCCEWRLSG